MRPQRVAVVVPTYNEAANLERCIALIRTAADDARIDASIIVVDDNSPDGTGRLAETIAARQPDVAVIHRACKEGLGRAYIDGFHQAIASGAELIVQIDADLSHDPRAIPSLVDAASNADVVLGSRYIAGGRVENWGLVRRAISRGGCAYARLLLGLDIRDVTGGFKCFTRHALSMIDFATVSAAGYAFQIEMTYRAVLMGLRVTEIPITFRDREAGSSKMSFSIALEAARMVPRLRLSQTHARGHGLKEGRVRLAQSLANPPDEPPPLPDPG